MEVFCGKGVLENFANCTEKNTYVRVSFYFTKRKFMHKCFPKNFVKFLKIKKNIEHLRACILKALKQMKTLGRNGLV